MPPAGIEPAAAPVAARGFNPDCLAVPLAIALVAALAVPHLPPGICFGDSGDLQVAAVTLGMAHPPGYGGFASVGYLLTLIPGLEPAYAVTLGCLASGLIALAFIAGLQIRLGANPWLAAAVTLGLAASTRVWEALVVPEVYAPNLALHAAAAWFFVTYVQSGRLRRLALAGLFLGFALANRPSTLLCLPGFALALLVYWWRNQPARSRWLPATAVALVTLLLPCIYTLAYYYVRDCPGTPLNIIENQRIRCGNLPVATGGVAAKLERVLWLATAREYRALLDGSMAHMGGRRQWLLDRLGLSNDLAMIAVTCAVVIGGALAWRRCRPTAIALIGIALGAAAFVCVYEVYDTAADVLPIMFTGGVFVGLCASMLLPAKSAFAKRALGIPIFLVAGLWITFRAGQPVRDATRLDATHYAPAAELRSLPQNAAVLSEWVNSSPLRYAQYRLDRPDLLIAIPKAKQREVAARLGDGGQGRPVFSTSRITPPPGQELTPWGKLWRISPVSAPAAGVEPVVTPKAEHGVSEGAQEQQ
jgi:hypothetical protein